MDYGPFYQYVEKEEELETIKGHIDFKDYVSRKIPNGLNNKFLCSFSEFEFDNIVNRIIKYTCRSLRNATASAKNQKIIRQVLIRLNEVSDVRCSPADCDGIRLSKMHRQYAVLMSMSKMFLLEFGEGGNILSAPLRCPQCHNAEDWKEIPSFGRGIPINNNVRIFAPRGILTVFFKMRYKCGKCGYTAKYSQW